MKRPLTFFDGYLVIEEAPSAFLERKAGLLELR